MNVQTCAPLPRHQGSGFNGSNFNSRTIALGGGGGDELVVRL